MLVYGNVSAALEELSVTAAHYANKTEKIQNAYLRLAVCVRI